MFLGQKRSFTLPMWLDIGEVSPLWLSRHVYVKSDGTFLRIFRANDHVITSCHDHDIVWCACRAVNTCNVPCAFINLTEHMRVVTGVIGGPFFFYKFKCTTLAFIFLLWRLFLLLISSQLYLVFIGSLFLVSSPCALCSLLLLFSEGLSPGLEQVSWPW